MDEIKRLREMAARCIRLSRHLNDARDVARIQALATASLEAATKLEQDKAGADTRPAPPSAGRLGSPG